MDLTCVRKELYSLGDLYRQSNIIRNYIPLVFGIRSGRGPQAEARWSLSSSHSKSLRCPLARTAPLLARVPRAGEISPARLR